MNNLIITKPKIGNDTFPFVELNAETGTCIISGNSYMQNPDDFFKPVIKWLKEYSILNKGDLLFFSDIDNMNTGTSRVLYEILDVLRSYKRKGANVKIKWNFRDKSDNHIHDVLDVISEFGIEVESLIN